MPQAAILWEHIRVSINISRYLSRFFRFSWHFPVCQRGMRRRKEAAKQLWSCQRTSPFRYLSAKAMAYFTGNAVMVFVCYALNLLACELTYGEAYPTPFGERYTELYYMDLADNQHRT